VYRHLRLATFAALTATFAAASTDAQVSSNDPARRGLDLFVHAPGSGAPRSLLPVQIEAFGFPSIVSLVPLAGATVEAAWDPETLGPGISQAPPPVRATTDTTGRLHLDVPIPEGDVRTLGLLLGVRYGAHERTRKITVQRGPSEKVTLHVADRRVVPGSSVSAWVTVTRAATGEPIGASPVEIALLEGGYARTRVKLLTDAAGTAMTRVPIPRTDEPTWTWQLRARSLTTGEHDAAHDSAQLTPREETPGSPWLSARWSESSVLAGDHPGFTLRVRDASDQPIVGLPIRYWVGPRGTEPPKDQKGWEISSTSALTDASGEVIGAAAAPTTVVQGVGTTLRIVAKTKVEGHDLEDSSTVAVGVPTSTAVLLPEAGAIVPGVEQRMLLRVRDGRRKPVSAGFSIKGDGLDAQVTTDDHGEAEVVWHPPLDVGALRNVGPCAGGVAAAVIVRALGEVPALRPRREPFELCVSIDRDASAMLRLERPIGTVGEKLRVRVVEPDAPRGKARGPKPVWSLVVRSESGEQAASTWVEDGDEGGDLLLPPASAGTWSLSAASPGTSRASRVIGSALLVTPRVLPKLRASIGAGRIAPGGSIEVDAELVDGKGRGLQGTVAAVVVDLHGGGSTTGLERLDTRLALCRALGVEPERCDPFVDGDPALDPLRRAQLGAAGASPLVPDNDPAKNTEETLNQAFGEVLHSLEGAIFEAAQSADRLRDVRRRGQNGWTWNPELMTLVTAAMSKPPETPGGEPLTLADLLAVDPQVTFDNVARRVTRLKLFRVLSAVRAFRKEHGLDPDEPVFKNPNALLRRLVRDGRLAEDLLLDPWGGTIQFTPSAGPPIPFLTAVKGFELHAPGPDGAVGTGDDVRDPFERVLRSGTPYAKAVSEDRLVDARFDLEVGDATVANWESLFHELTGQAIGDSFGAGGLGLSGVGSGGGGRGAGIGLGSVGTTGHGRGTSGIANGVAFWSIPRRTDANGRLRIHVPLGDIETTWRVALVGVPDGARPATTTLDVPVALPLSARVDAGATWVAGDRVSAAITLRNRSSAPLHARVEATPGGVALLPEGKPGATKISEVDIPAGAAQVVILPLHANVPGEGSLAVTVKAPGLPDDHLRHTWEVIAPGEPTDLSRSQWVEQSAELSVDIDPSAMRLRGKPRLLLERGFDEALRAALDALDPDRLRTTTSLVDAMEVASRLDRWATLREGESSAVALRAAETARRALGRYSVYRGLRSAGWSTAMRASIWAPFGAVVAKASEVSSCPPALPGSLDEQLEGLDAEPAMTGGAALACWNVFVTETVESVLHAEDPVALARAVLALAERPHRDALTATLVDRLREKVALRASGGISLPGSSARDRADRATVFAALLRSARLGRPIVAPPARLAAWIAVQRGDDGGYGSSLATRFVVRALLASSIEVKGHLAVIVTENGKARTVDVAPSARVELPLDAQTTSVKLDVKADPCAGEAGKPIPCEAISGVVVRFERPVLRFWSKPPEQSASPLHLDLSWPSDARAGSTGVLRVSLRQQLGGSPTIDVRVPLPPAVTLAEPVNGVQQIQGVLRIRRTVDASHLATPLEIPLRFGLTGYVTVPEARAEVAFEDVPRAIAPARPLWVR
jgi:hypothetical protein